MSQPPDPPSAGTPSSDWEGTRRRAARDLRGDMVRYVPSQVIPALVAVITIPVLTRLLSPAEFGEYRLVLAAVGLFGAAAGWIASGVYRFFPASEVAGRLDAFRATINRLLATTLGLFVILWLAGMWAFQSSVDISEPDLFLIGAVLMIITTIWAVASAEVRAVREVGWYSSVVVLNKVLTFGFGVGLVVWAGLAVDGLLYGSIIASLLLLPFLIGVVRRRLPRSGRFDRELAGQVLRYGLPVALVQITLWMLQLSDRFIIAAFRGEAEVGLYSAAYGIAEQGMETILLLFQLPFDVLGSRVWERDGVQAAAQFVSDSARSYFLVAIPAWAGLSVLAVPIMSVMTASPYHEASVIIPVVSLALMVSALQWWYMTGSMFNKKTGQILISFSAAVVVNLVLNLLLVAEYGYQVTALTTLIGYVVGAIVMILLARRDFRWRFPFASVGRSLAAAGAMTVTIWALMGMIDLGAAATLVLMIPIGILVYGLVLWSFGEPQARRLLARLRRV